MAEYRGKKRERERQRLRREPNREISDKHLQVLVAEERNKYKKIKLGSLF